MSAEPTTRELVVVCAMLFNMAALLASFVWAWRGGYLSGLDDQSTNLHPASPIKENPHG